jgi:hypothetical protein
MLKRMIPLKTEGDDAAADHEEQHNAKAPKIEMHDAHAGDKFAHFGATRAERRYATAMVDQNRQRRKAAQRVEMQIALGLPCTRHWRGHIACSFCSGFSISR